MAGEEAERLAEEAERLAREEAERAARDEAEILAREDAEHLAKEEMIAKQGRSRAIGKGGGTASRQGEI